MGASTIVLLFLAAGGTGFVAGYFLSQFIYLFSGHFFTLK